MATPNEWASGYARQAQADFVAWQALEEDDSAQPCHRMMLLQMASEKLCKARLIDGGTPPVALQTSHAYVANPLPIVIRSQLEVLGENLRARAGLLQFARHLASEIEVTNPAVTRDGRRPENCEYPWEDTATNLHSPLDHNFIPLQLLRDRHGPLFVKMLKLAIDRAVVELNRP